MTKEDKLKVFPVRLQAYNEIAEKSEYWIKLYWSIIRNNWNEKLCVKSVLNGWEWNYQDELDILKNNELKELNKQYKLLLRF